MPEMAASKAITHITTGKPNARILVLTSFATDDKVFPAIKAGALGLFAQGFQSGGVGAGHPPGIPGRIFLHPTIARQSAARAIAPPCARPKNHRRTADRTRSGCTAPHRRGMGNQQIADNLVISEATVRTHVSNILSKTSPGQPHQAALYALQKGLASLDDAG